MRKVELKCIDKTISIDDLLSKIKCFEDDIIFLSGSLIENITGKYSKNMGNIKSDIDVFIFTDNIHYAEMQSIYECVANKTTFLKFDNINYDIEIYTKESIISLSESINGIKWNIDDKVNNILKLPKGWRLEKTNYILNRMKHYICIKNEKYFKEILEQFNYKKFSMYYEYHLMNELDNSYEDVIGNLDGESISAGFYSLRVIYYNFIKILIYHNGEFIDRDKWAILKLKNMSPDFPLLTKAQDLYETIFFDMPMDFLSQKEIIKNCLMEINEIIAQI